MDRMTMSVSRLSVAHSCSRAYRYKYVDGLTPKDRPMTLRTGSLIHSVLEEFYRLSFDYETVINRWRNDALEGLSHGSYEEDEIGKAVEIARNVANVYPTKWAGDLDQHQIVAVEHPFNVDGRRIRNGKLIRDRSYAFNGVLDLVLRNKRTGEMVVVEHKTTKMKNPESAMRPYQPSPQGIGYLAVARDLFLVDDKWPDGQDCPGIKLVFNFIRKAVPKQPAINKNGSVSKAWIDTTIDVYTAALTAARQDFSDYGEILTKLQLQPDTYLFRHECYPCDGAEMVFWETIAEAVTEVRARARANSWPRRYTGCQRYGRACEFATICLGEIAEVDDEMTIQLMFDRRGAVERDEKDQNDDIDIDISDVPF